MQNLLANFGIDMIYLINPLKKQAFCAARRCALALVVSATAVTSFAQMSLPFGAAVTSSGGASISIPIATPAGVSSIAPPFALVYDSQAGNGIVGVGWSMSGFSAVSRCVKTRASDGVIAPIKNVSQDGYCLDGRKFLLVGGTYGANGSEYRMEIDDGTQVKVVGSSGSGPASFIVRTKAGLTQEFGNTSDSAIEISAGSATRARWMINKIIDTKGNYIAYNYIKDTTGGLFNGGVYLDRVEYGANASAGIAASAKINFLYDYTRSDIRQTYVAGNMASIRGRLASIVTTSASQAVGTYAISYDTSVESGRSRLKSVTYCNSSGQCFPSFSATFPTPVTSPYQVSGRNSSGTGDVCLVSCGSWQALDVNGDGRVDLVHLTNNPGDVRVWRANSNGTFAVSASTYTADTGLQNGGWQVLDVNGDGLLDLVHQTTNAGDTRVWKSNGDGTFAISKLVTSTDTGLQNGRWQVFDVDGDGLVDMVHLTDNPGDVRVWRSNGDGTFAISQLLTSADTNLASGLWQSIDVDGDGLTDMVHLTANTGLVIVWRSNGDGTFSISSYNVTADTDYTNGYWRTGDFNGDGLADMVHLTTNSGMAIVWTSKGDGTFAVNVFTTNADTNLQSGSFYVVDYNSDGNSDLVHLTANSGDARLWISNGAGGFGISQFITSTDTSLTAGSWQLGDFKGDGNIDLVHLGTDAGVNIYWSNPRNSLDVPQVVSNGIGPSHSFLFATLPQLLNQSGSTGAYTMTARTASPSTVTTVIMPMRVLGALDVSDGVGGVRRTSYRYDSLRVDRAGRGFLGFGWTQQSDSVTGLVSRTYIRQDWPLIGMPYSSQRGTSESALGNLGAEETLYSFIALTPADVATTCTDSALGSPSTCSTSAIASGKRYVVYPAQMDTRAYDLDGTALPRTRVVNQGVDKFGNINTVITQTLNPSGSSADFSKTVSNIYATPDTTNWILGRLLTSRVDASTVATTPTSITPGSGGLAQAPAPKLTAQQLAPMLSLLLDD